jgi:hypothetical protein
VTDERPPAAIDPGDAFQHFALFYDGVGDGLPDLRKLLSAPNSVVWVGGEPSKVSAALEELGRMVAAGAPYTIAGQIEGSLDADELLDRVKSGVISLASRGHARVYVLALDTWGAPGWPPPEDLMWLDSRMDAALAMLSVTLICTFDAARLPARGLFYETEIHRYVSYGDAVFMNPLYVGLDEWLSSHLPKLPWLAGRSDGQRPLHVGAFYRGIEDLYAQLGPGIAEGVKRGEKAIHFIDPAARADHEGRLSAAGVDVKSLEGSGRLDIRGWDQVYLVDGTFDADRQLGLVAGLVTEPRPRTRLVANMSWALLGASGSDQLLDYEARLNTLLDRHTQTVICAYDLERFDPWTLLGAIRTHPVVLIDGKLTENSLYEPAAVGPPTSRASNA